MEAMINNLINGNLTDARKQAKRFSGARIRLYLLYVRGWSDNKALITGAYLKGKATWQEYCNAI